MAGLSVFRTLRRSVFLWFGAIFSFVGLIMISAAVQEWRAQRYFAQHALSAQGTILSKGLEKATRDGNPRTRYLATYRFAASDGRTIEKTSEVSVDEWERLNEGDSFAVRYLPSDPNTTQHDAQGEGWAPIAIGGVGGVFMVIGVLVGRSDLRYVLLVHRLARSGFPAEATVRNVWPTNTSINRVRQWRLSYEFSDHVGRTQHGESHLLSPDEAAGWRQGDTGAVRFDRTRPQDSVWIGRPEP